jgi:TRAP-type mannitol/chloroaromatic compound transport system permease small subunit
MDNLRRFNKTIDQISRKVAAAASYFLILMMGVVTFEVVARYVFNRPTEWAMEITQFTLLLLAVLGGAYTLLTGGHVNVDIIYGRFTVKTRAVISLFTSLLIFLFLGVLLWKSWDMFITSFRLNEHSASLFAPPLYPVKCLVPIGVCLILLQSIVRFIRYFITAVTGIEEEKEVAFVRQGE